MVKKRPQLNLDELNLLKWLLGGLLALISAWSVSYLEVDAFFLLVVITVAVPIVSFWPKLPYRWPNWAHRLIFPVVVAFFAYDLYMHREPLPAMVRLDVLLLLYRAITYRKKRDDLQLIVLGLFLITVAGVLTVSLAFALQIVAFTACALLLLLVVTLISAAEAQTVEPGAVLPASTLAPAWTQVGLRRLGQSVFAATDWRLIVLSAGLFAGVVGVSAVIFLAIPRFQLNSSLFFDRLANRKVHTGFSDTLKFHDVTDIQQDNGVAFRVEVTDRSKLPRDPYWRMIVLDEYSDSSFHVSPALARSSFALQENAHELYGSEPITPGPRVYWTFYLEPSVSRFLPLAGSYRHLDFTEAQSFRASKALSVVGLLREPISMTAYRVRGMNTEPTLFDPAFGQQRRTSQDENRSSATMLPSFLSMRVGPEDRTVLGGIVAQITGGRALDPIAFARAACAWIRSNHRYSLSMQLTPGKGDPLVRWMTSREPGHCELFAGAFTLLARTAGLPTRIVAGFRGGMLNEDYLMVSNADAHAWCEIFDGKDRWMRVDPTDATVGNGVAVGNNALLGESSLRLAENGWTSRLDRLRLFWYRRIVNFEQDDQLQLLRSLSRAGENSGEQIRGVVDRGFKIVRAWLARPWSLRRFIIIFGFLVSLAALLWSWRRYVRPKWIQWKTRSPRAGDPVRAEAGRWLLRLRVAGSRHAVCAELERLRYGERKTWPNTRTVFRSARQALRAAEKSAK